jgi:hypothetical protein
MTIELSKQITENLERYQQSISQLARLTYNISTFRDHTPEILNKIDDLLVDMRQAYLLIAEYNTKLKFEFQRFIGFLGSWKPIIETKFNKEQKEAFIFECEYIWGRLEDLKNKVIQLENKTVDEELEEMVWVAKTYLESKGGNP